MKKKLSRLDVRNVLREEFIDMAKERSNSNFKISKSKVNSIIQEEVARALSVIREVDDPDGAGVTAEPVAGSIDVTNPDPRGQFANTSAGRLASQMWRMLNHLNVKANAAGMGTNGFNDTLGKALQDVWDDYVNGDESTAITGMERIAAGIGPMATGMNIDIGSDFNERFSEPVTRAIRGASAARVDGGGDAAEPAPAERTRRRSSWRSKAADGAPFGKNDFDAADAGPISKMQKVVGAPSATDDRSHSRRGHDVNKHGDGYWGGQTQAKWAASDYDADDDGKMDQDETAAVLARWGELAGTGEVETGGGSGSWENDLYEFTSDDDGKQYIGLRANSGSPDAHDIKLGDTLYMRVAVGDDNRFWGDEGEGWVELNVNTVSPQDHPFFSSNFDAHKISVQTSDPDEEVEVTGSADADATIRVNIIADNMPSQTDNWTVYNMGAGAEQLTVVSDNSFAMGGNLEVRDEEGNTYSIENVDLPDAGVSARGVEALKV